MRAQLKPLDDKSAFLELPKALAKAMNIREGDWFELTVLPDGGLKLLPERPTEPGPTTTSPE